MPQNNNVRSLSLSILMHCEQNGQYSNIALDTAIKNNNLSPADRCLLTLLVFGVIEKQVTLDYYIDKLSSLPPTKIEPTIRMILRLGLYQLSFTDRIPDHAAVNESVALAPRRASGFVNALLRRYLREKDKIAPPSPSAGLPRYLSVKYSFPAELCAKFIDIYGDKRTEAIFSALNRVPGLTLRVNTLKIKREELLSMLQDAGFDAKPSALSPDGIYLDSAPLASLPGFEEGMFFVQDEASQLCVLALDARAGMTVIDCCAAPGSKSFGAALTMEDKGRVLSYDLHENKLRLIRTGAARLGINIIKTAIRNAREPSTAPPTADRVLCDVPCSGYGVMAKKPEIRHKKPASAAHLPDVQYDILKNSAIQLKPGGILVYSTCTLLPEENEHIINRFLAANQDFSLAPFTAGALNVPSGMITLAPDTHKTDGFFIAKLKYCDK